MPQGGVDKGEGFLNAAYRELEEETDIKKVELIKQLEGTSIYNQPSTLKKNKVLRDYTKLIEKS